MQMHVNEMCAGALGDSSPLCASCASEKHLITISMDLPKETGGSDRRIKRHLTEGGLQVFHSVTAVQ